MSLNFYQQQSDNLEYSSSSYQILCKHFAHVNTICSHYNRMEAIASTALIYEGENSGRHGLPNAVSILHLLKRNNSSYLSLTSMFLSIKLYYFLETITLLKYSNYMIDEINNINSGDTIILYLCLWIYQQSSTIIVCCINCDYFDERRS